MARSAAADQRGKAPRQAVKAGIDLREFAVELRLDQPDVALGRDHHLREHGAGAFAARLVLAPDLGCAAADAEGGLAREADVEADRAVAFLPAGAGVVEGARIGLGPALFLQVVLVDDQRLEAILRPPFEAADAGARACVDPGLDQDDQLALGHRPVVDVGGRADIDHAEILEFAAGADAVDADH